MTHQPTGRFYIGSSGNIRKRINEHFNLLRRDKHPAKGLQEAFTSTDDIVIEVTKAPDKDDALTAEQAMLDSRYADERCCNPSPWARTIWKDGMPEEQRQYLSNVMKGHPVSDHVKEAVRKANTGLKRSPETLQRMRDAKQGQAASMSKPVILDGVEYGSMKDAVAASGVTWITLSKRLKSDDPKWTSWVMK